MKILYHSLKNLIKKFGYDHLTKDIKINKHWYGSQYGGFFCYPNLINQESVVYSFGIGEDISFDLDIIKKHGCHVYGFDPTPKSINWIKQQQIPNEFIFYDFGIGVQSGNVKFYLPKNSDFISGSIVEQKNINTKESIVVKMKSLADIMQFLDHEKIDVLKIDIEGLEYELIESIVNSDIKIFQILVEFHDRFFPDGKQKSQIAVKKLKEKGFVVFAVSPTYEEVSFINKELIKP
jgi:FkbM family methyltransferase